ncbi:MAG: transcriptional regulator [Planctomycetes bacterium]|nr:transcriptional regulator [Planctomycetota bacterium]
MQRHPMRRVTIVIEALAREALCRLLTEVGAQGFTIFPVESHGAHAAQPSDIAEFGTLQCEAVVRPAAAEELLQRLFREFFPRYAVIAYESEVWVLRPEKF